MPNNPRQQIKHDIGRAINHVNWLQEILVITGEKYRKDHIEITRQYEVAYSYFEQGKELLAMLRDAY